MGKPPAFSPPLFACSARCQADIRENFQGFTYCSVFKVRCCCLQQQLLYAIISSLCCQLFFSPKPIFFDFEKARFSRASVIISDLPGFVNSFFHFCSTRPVHPAFLFSMPQGSAFFRMSKREVFRKQAVSSIFSLKPYRNALLYGSYHISFFPTVQKLTSARFPSHFFLSIRTETHFRTVPITFLSSHPYRNSLPHGSHHISFFPSVQKRSSARMILQFSLLQPYSNALPYGQRDGLPFCQADDRDNCANSGRDHDAIETESRFHTETPFHIVAPPASLQKNLLLHGQLPRQREKFARTWPRRHNRRQFPRST